MVTIAVALRVIHWESVAQYPWFDFLGLDSRYYDDWAQRILREGLQGEDPYFMGPLYPHLLALVYAVVGRSLDAVRVVQVAMSGVTVALVHVLARRFGGSRLAGIASGMAAIYGPLISYAVSIIYPTLNVLMTASMLLLLYEAARRRSLRFAFAAGAVIGLDALGRGNVLLFAPPAALWLAAAWGHPHEIVRPRLRATARVAFPFLAGLIVALAPAAIHNLRTDDPTLLTTNGGLNFYIGNGPMATGGYEMPVLYVERPDGRVERIVADVGKDSECLHEAELAAGRPLTYTEASRFWFDETLRFARREPGTFLWRFVVKAVHFWSAYEVPQIEHLHYLRRFSVVLRGPVLTFGIVGALSLVGMVLAWRRRAAWSLLYVFVATYFIATILFFILDRYRLPIIPGLFPFAGLAVLSAWDGIRTGRLLRAGGVAAGVAATILLMHANVFGIDESAGVAQMIYRQGIVADSQERWEDAIGHYREALGLKPDYEKCHLNLGIDLARVGRFEEALTHLDRAQELEPSYYRAAFNRGLVLEQLGRPEDARDAYARSVELEPRYLLGRSALAEMLLRENRRAEAREQVEAILSYDDRWEGEHNPAARARAARLRAYLDERDRLDQGGHGDCFAKSDEFRHAEIARLRGRRDEALAHLGAYFSAGGACAEAYRALGMILIEADETAGAEDAFLRAARADRDLPGVHLGLARLAAMRGDATGALRRLEEEIAADPDSPIAYLETGLVQERLLGDEASAETWYARYRERGGDPGYLEARRRRPATAEGES